MELLPSAEEQEMIDTVDHFLAKKLSRPQARDRIDAETGLDPSSRAEIAQLGVFSLALPEDAGGAGCGVVEESLVFVPFGRHLAPVDFVAAVLGARLAHLAGDASKRDAIAGGESSVALAVGLDDAEVSKSVSGTFQVFDLPGAGLVVVSSPDGQRLALVDAAAFTEAVSGECLDPTTKLARIELASAPTIISVDESHPEGLVYVGTLLVAALLVGVADAARDLAVAYAGEREQFGRPIGVNQAIKHPCADMAVRCEAATSLLYFAAVAVRDGREDRRFQVAAAKHIASEAARLNARANVQIHGGMGYTWEHDAHLLLSRALVLEHCFGGDRHQSVALLESEPAIP